MYAKIKNGNAVKFPYTTQELYEDNPGVYFSDLSDETLARVNAVRVVSTGAQHDPAMQVSTQDGCAYNTERQRWETTWMVRNKTQQELADEAAQYQTQLEAQRSDAYRIESDPLFFKAQRGEATIEEWRAKVAEIKARYQ